MACSAATAPGMVMAPTSLLEENPSATEEEIRIGLGKPVPLHGVPQHCAGSDVMHEVVTHLNHRSLVTK